MSRGLGRSLDGRLRRDADRHEAAGRVLEPLHHERVLSDGERSIRGRRRWPPPKRSRRASRPRRRRGRPASARRSNLASAAAWSPNPNNPPLYLDLPVKDGKVRPDIVAKWAANAPLAMVEQYVAEPEEVLRDRDRGRHQGHAARLEPAAARGDDASARRRTPTRSTTAITPTRSASGSSGTCCRSSRRTWRRRRIRPPRRLSPDRQACTTCETLGRG